MFSRLMLLTSVAVCLTLPALAKNTGFEGKWIIDKQASTANFDIPDNLTQQIKQKGSELVVQTTWREPKNGIAPLPLLGIMVTEMKFATNGEEERKQVGPFVQVIKTTQDGNSLVSEYTAASEETKSVAGKWTRSLSPDGRQMTLEISQTGSGQNAQGRLVFHRK